VTGTNIQTRQTTVVDPATRVATTVWRVLFAAIAWWALYLGLTRGNKWNIVNLHYWSQFSTLTVALAATGSLLAPLWLRDRFEPREGFLRGAATTYTTITLVLFPILLSGTYRNLDGQLMHLAVPILCVADWLFVGRNQQRVRWFWPVAWLAIPLAYLPFYIQRSNEAGALYKFLDPSKSGFVTMVFVLLGAFLIAGIVVWGAGRLRGVIVESRAEPTYESIELDEFRQPSHPSESADRRSSSW
jgi:hypothetical protein